MTNEFIEQIFALKNRDADPDMVEPDPDPATKTGSCPKYKIIQLIGFFFYSLEPLLMVSGFSLYLYKTCILFKL